MPAAPEGLSLRASREEDGEQLARLHERAWRVSYEGLADPAWIIERPIEDRIEEWRGYARGDGFPMFVADDGGAVVGFVAFGLTRDLDAPAGTGEVVALYVDPDRQGAGVGGALLSRAASELRAQGFERATLWTLEASEQSRGFYEKHGWVLDGARKTERWEHVRYARDL